MSVWFRSRLSVCMYVCMCVEYVYTMSSRYSDTDIVHVRLHAHVYVHSRSFLRLL
jgi:hypothetical protein